MTDDLETSMPKNSIDSSGVASTPSGIDERFDSALKAHGIDLTNPESGSKLNALSNDSQARIAILKEAGVSRDDLRASVEENEAEKIKHPLITSFALGGTAGVAVGVAVAAIASGVSAGRSSWQAFLKTAPKPAAVGFVIGSVTGLVISHKVNRELDHKIGVGNEEINGWAEAEASRKKAASAAPKSPDCS